MAVEKGIFAEYERCLQDEPAACASRCPVHVDVVQLCKLTEAGDFAGAFALLRKRVPLAGVVCAICDHPCDAVCVRSGLDAAVNIHEIERAVLSLGYAEHKTKFQLAKKKGRVAVVGGGLSGLCCALELDRKGFSVAVFEATARLGGWAWQLLERLGPVYAASGMLAEEALSRELATLSAAGIELHLSTYVDKPRLEQLKTEFQAVYLATAERDGAPSANAETMQVGASNLFAGGFLGAGGDSLIEAVAQGKRAANSIERFIKKTSLTAQREREGAYVTKLPVDSVDRGRFLVYTPAVDKEPSPVYAVYTREQAQAEAARCLKCECDACLRGCAHMQKYGRKPKTYAREIYTNENVFLGTRYANTMINSCTLCGLCKQLCPIDLGMEELIRQARRTMVTTEKMPPSAHDFALRDMEFSNSEQFFSLRGDPRGDAERTALRGGESHLDPCGDVTSSDPRSDMRSDANATPSYLFFPGCQLAASAPEHVRATYGWLLDNFPNKIDLLLGCCGAPADWAGRDDLMLQTAENIRAAWQSSGRPLMLCACSSCADVFARYLPEVETVSLWELMATRASTLAADLAASDSAGNLLPAKGAKLGVHDACGGRGDARMQTSLRKLVESLGYELEEPRYAGAQAQCCGFGGDVWFANREQAEGFATLSADGSQNDLLVYCAMCKDLISATGKRCYHVLDLLFGSPATLGGAGAVQDETGADGRIAPPPQYKMPTLSERQFNRAELKNRMLMEFWNERSETTPPGDFEHTLRLEPQVKEAMEKRLILVDDIIDVIRGVENGSVTAFVNKEDGSLLAGKRRKFVTYWVRYLRDGDAFVVQSAYSHRMEILG